MINVDDNEGNALVRSWASGYGITFPILQDENDVTYGQYGDGFIPYNVLLDRFRTIRFTDSDFDVSFMENLIELYNAPVYSHLASMEQKYLEVNTDSILINSTLVNPESRNVMVRAIYTGANTAAMDSVQMFDDGMHDDGIAGDDLFGGYIGPLSIEDEYIVSVGTQDLDFSSYYLLENIGRFTTIGPIVFGSYTITQRYPIFILFEMNLRNDGLTGTAENVSATLSSNDSRVVSIGGNPSYGNIGPGQTATSSGIYVIAFSGLSEIDTIGFNFNIYSNGTLYWQDSSVTVIVGLQQNNPNIPTSFSLKQNYPNPFNPKTTIEFSIPKSEYVELKIFDVSGKEIQTLVSDNMNAGTYQYDWNAAGTVASGIYYYVIKVGEFTDTKKLVLLK